MKIPASLRRIYEDQKAISDRLQTTVDGRMRGLKNSRWHYESRVKTLPSFALKVESGRFRDPGALEDFFACTLVVANAAEMAAAETLIHENFTVKERRPPAQNRTHKTSDAFPFDDLRLYVTLPESPTLPPTDLAEVVFEVQIKTFLQHAWSIATHDLLYKTDDANWSKERIAYQVKAMLEHAEVSIQEAERLATCGVLAKEDARTAETKRAIALVKAQWSPGELPDDVRRLATNITTLLRALKLDIERLEQILNEGKAAAAGKHPLNLSPYAVVLQYLFSAEKPRMLSVLTEAKTRTRVLIPAEVELPPDVDRGPLKNAIFVPAGDVVVQ